MFASGTYILTFQKYFFKGEGGSRVPPAPGSASSTEKIPTSTLCHWTIEPCLLRTSLAFIHDKQAMLKRNFKMNRYEVDQARHRMWLEQWDGLLDGSLRKYVLRQIDPRYFIHFLKSSNLYLLNISGAMKRFKFPILNSEILSTFNTCSLCQFLGNFRNIFLLNHIEKVL